MFVGFDRFFFFGLISYVFSIKTKVGFFNIS